MKKKLIIGIVIVLIAALGYVLLTSKNTQPTAQKATTPATATSLKKTLRITNASSGTEKEIETTEAAATGDTLKTDSSGRALIEQSNGTKTVLDYNSEMTIAALDPSGTRTSNFLKAGTAWARVKKVFAQGEFYEIETQNGVAVVRGTALQITYRSPDTILLVEEGDVSLIPIDEKTRVRQFDKEVRVAAGMKGTIGADGTTVTAPMTDAEKQSDFYTFGVTTTAGDTTATDQGEGTLRSLLATGRDMRCVYIFGNDSVSTTATIYFSGNTLRGDFSINSDTAATSDTHILQTDTHMYSWSGTQGIKIVVENTNAGNTTTSSPMGSYVDLDAQINYNCEPWKKDAKLFSVPTEVSFIDMSTMMQGQMGIPPGN